MHAWLQASAIEDVLSQLDGLRRGGRRTKQRLLPDAMPRLWHARMFKLPAVPLSLTVLRRVCAPGLSCRSCPVRVLQMQTIRSFSELNYWGKSSDAMDRYQAPSGAMYYDPNTTPMWAPTIPVALIPARKPTAGVCEPAL